MKPNKSLLFISKILKRISSATYYLGMATFRKAYVQDELNTKIKLSKGAFVDNKAIKKQWEKIHVNKVWYGYYNSIVRETKRPFDARYIPLDIEYSYIDDWFNNTNAALVIDDKNMYDMYFHDVNMPTTVGRIINRQFFDEHYNVISKQTLINRCKSFKHVILKPAVSSSAGHGINFWNESEGVDALEKMFDKRENIIIQTLIKQHDAINKIYPDSVNSIRIVTCHFKGKTRVLSSVIRMGQDGNKLDNASQGGLFCGINEDGALKKYAYTKYGVACTTHPQGAVFAECRIPNFDKCKELVINLSNRFLRISKLISWDLAMGEDGEPVLIEVNLCYGGTDIHQIANGPLFGDITDEVLNRVFKQQRKYRIVNKLLSIYR
jgi:hypothetical protein